MGNKSLGDPSVNLVIFTCSGREHLLLSTLKSFKKYIDFRFNQTILAIDGEVNPAILQIIKPDIVIQHFKRNGYVSSISKTLTVIDAPYFFWLEDDWSFKEEISISDLLKKISSNTSWTQIILSKFGPLSDEQKKKKLFGDFYETDFGFSANPSLCNTGHIRSAFELLKTAVKGDVLGHDGFENFLTRTFNQAKLVCAIQDPKNNHPIKHEGYLETTARNWHMINSLETRTPEHLLTIPRPSIPRRLIMLFKLFWVFLSLSFRQLFNNKTYEFCFRVITGADSAKKDD
ncbi:MULTISPECIES: hypothetical protein [unclassified Pedobacter]|uniref:hypothetical protein n=1 Tax=unclassified Pedobacter TaxID=2628915 RepID=UPI001D87F9E9|nr:MULTISPECIES: hypothetical protein [unclassified Pedobacter]CAH0166551.1 hypothetical protein SRABI126_00919 [Pedobacter sp. Bi126]CAH0285020.1 hypothetical protein SRABI36_04131 [Pedobacter sp. Bi36]